MISITILTNVVTAGASDSAVNVDIVRLMNVCIIIIINVTSTLPKLTRSY